MQNKIKTLILTAVSVFVLTPLLAQASGMVGSDGRFERQLRFYNTHTRENLDVAYWKNGRYDSAAMAEVNRYLRDHRNGHVHTISQDLLNLLHALKMELQSRHPDKDIVFHVISGFRSPETNATLRANGGGQAKKSRHMSGDAIDIRVPGIKSSEIRDIAWCLQRGGVGFYRGSNFVHVDTHRVRHWNWSPTASTCNGGNS